MAEKPSDINAIRVATGECDALIGGDLVVVGRGENAGPDEDRAHRGVVNSHEIITGDFTRNTEFRLPTDRLGWRSQARLPDGLAMFDASDLAKALMGDSIYSNMMVFGAAWQHGRDPGVGHEAILRAIELNGAAVERNMRAFEFGRWAVLHPPMRRRCCRRNVVALPKTTGGKDRVPRGPPDGLSGQAAGQAVSQNGRAFYR